jgi:hypothetical protein
MLRFTQYLLEESYNFLLILEGKGQHQFVNQYGDKILKRIFDEGASHPLGYGLKHYDQYIGEAGHGTPEHKTTYILKSLGIPESPDYLDISKPDHAKTWNSHVNWILKSYANGSEQGGINRVEDVYAGALPYLKRFTKLVDEGKLKHESLSKWKNLSDLQTSVNRHDPLDNSGLEPHEYTKIGENEHWNVVVPHTANAACSLGHGTSWCTTNGRFEYYNEMGPLHIAIPKNPQGEHGAKERYQIHVNSDQFMDIKDRPADVKTTFKDRPLPDSVIKTVPDSDKFQYKMLVDPSMVSKEDVQSIVSTHNLYETRIKDTKKDRLYMLALQSPHVTEDQLTKVLSDRTPAEKIKFNYNKEKHDKAKIAALSNPNVTEDNLYMGLNDPNSKVNWAAASNLNATEDHIIHFTKHAKQAPDTSLSFFKGEDTLSLLHHIDSLARTDDRYKEKKQQLIKHLPREAIDWGVNDKDFQHLVVQSPNATDEHLTKVLMDHDFTSSRMALLHPLLQPQHIHIALDNPHSWIRHEAMMHPNASIENLTKGAQDKDNIVRLAAYMHNNVTPELFANAQNDEDPLIKTYHTNPDYFRRMWGHHDLFKRAT